MNRVTGYIFYADESPVVHGAEHDYVFVLCGKTGTPGVSVGQWEINCPKCIKAWNELLEHPKEMRKQEGKSEAVTRESLLALKQTESFEEIMISETKIRRVRVLQKECRNFLRVFQSSIIPFWNNLYGFDVIAFDEWLKVPDSKLTRDVVLEHYGEEGAALIDRLTSDVCVEMDKAR